MPPPCACPPLAAAVSSGDPVSSGHPRPTLSRGDRRPRRRRRRRLPPALRQILTRGPRRLTAGSAPATTLRSSRRLSRASCSRGSRKVARGRRGLAGRVREKRGDGGTTPRERESMIRKDFAFASDCSFRADVDFAVGSESEYPVPTAAPPHSCYRSTPPPTHFRP